MNRVDVKIISLQSYLRPALTYKAHVSNRTGKLLRITAGCRTWSSFDVAAAHYRGEGPYWSGNKWCDSQIDVCLNEGSWIVAAWREEARRILKRLSGEVEIAQGRIKRRRKAVRK